MKGRSPTSVGEHAKETSWPLALWWHGDRLRGRGGNNVREGAPDSEIDRGLNLTIEVHRAAQAEAEGAIQQHLRITQLKAGRRSVRRQRQDMEDEGRVRAD